MVNVPTRSDSRRKHDQLLAAARATFAEQGTEASLREVARRADVGIGTLYRHFPTREALLEELLGESFDALYDLAVELRDAPDSHQALVAWVRAMAVGSTRYDGLPASVAGALRDPESRLHASCDAMRRAAAEVLERAQRDGRVRADLTTGEMLAAANAMAWAAKQANEPVDRYVELLMNGLSGF